MHDALTLIVDSELDNIEVFTVVVQRGDLDTGGFVGNTGDAFFALGLIGGHVVVGVATLASRRHGWRLASGVRQMPVGW
jgi:hypothetical protein